MLIADHDEVKKPSAAAVSRSLADMPDLGLYRAAHPGESGFIVRQVPARQRRQHGGPVIVRWSERPEGGQTDEQCDVVRGRQARIQVALEHVGYAVTHDPMGNVVLLAPEDVAAHEQAHRAAKELLGDALVFLRTEASGLLAEDGGRPVERVHAQAELTLALRYGDPSIRHDDATGMVTVDLGDSSVRFTPLRPDPTAARLSALDDARQQLQQAGEPVLDDETAREGTGAWVRSSSIPGEVLVLRKDDGQRTVGFSRMRWTWERFMDTYRLLWRTQASP